MRVRSVACAQKQKRLRRRVSTPCVLLLLACFGTVSSLECPRRCVCSGTRVECTNQNLTSIPQPLPANTTTLFLTGNNISSLTEEAFPVVLDQLSELHLPGNLIKQVGPGAFHNLPSLNLLDMSNNRLLNFSPDAFLEDNSLQVLDLTRSLCDFFPVNVVSNLLQRSVKLSNLSLASNGLVILPEGTFTTLPELTALDLRNNSIVSIKNGTFRNPELNSLDLRDNALKELSNDTLLDFSQIPGLRVFLAENPWRCDCNIEDMVIWLQNSDFVVDKLNLTCAEPAKIKNTRVLEHSELQCTYPSDMERVLETSYVFLGMVLALIGVIFLLVLYLNRKGIKRWIYNIRDACRDHMEGYHYRKVNNGELINAHYKAAGTRTGIRNIQD